MKTVRYARVSMGSRETCGRTVGRGRGALLLLAALALTGGGAGRAAVLYWDLIPGSDAWSATGNWSTVSGADVPDPGAAPGSADTAVFNVESLTATLSAAVFGGSILFDAGAGAFVLGTGAADSETYAAANGSTQRVAAGVATDQTYNVKLQLGTNAAAATHTLQNDSTAAKLLFNGSIVGATGGAAGVKTLAVGGAGNLDANGAVGKGGGSSLTVIKSGAGTLKLNNSATAINLLTLNGGVVDLASDISFGTVGNGAQVLNGTGGTIASSGGRIVLASGQNAANGPDWAGGPSGITVEAPIVNGTSGFNNVDFYNTGILVLKGTNAYTGGTILQGTQVRIGVDSVGSVGAIVSGPFGTGPMKIQVGAYLSSDSTNARTVLNAAAIENNVVFGDPVANGRLTFRADANLNAARTVTVSSNCEARFEGGLTNSAGALVKAGPGTLTLAGSNTYAGATTVNAGRLALDYSAADASKLSDGAALVLGGGAVTLAGGTHVEVVASNVLNAGDSSIAGGGGATLRLNAIVRSPGATVDFGADNLADTDTPNTGEGILGAFATVSGATWAVSAATAADTPITGLPSGGYLSTTQALDNAGLYGFAHVDVNSSQAPDDGISPLTLRFHDGAAPFTLTLTNVNTIGAGGILVTEAVGANPAVLTGGFLQSGNTQDLAIIQRNVSNDLTIASVIQGNGGATNLTKGGPGVLTLSGSNTFSGWAYVGAGTLRPGSDAAFANTCSLALRAAGRFDLNGYSPVLAGWSDVDTAAVTDGGAAAGTGTLTINNAGTIAARVLDGSNRVLALRIVNNNGSFLMTNPANTFSGGLVLANNANGTRMAPGTIVAGAYGSGAITIGEANTDKAQIYFATANQTLSNNLVVNSALGTDVSGTFRLEGNQILRGTITANLADAAFGTYGGGGALLSGQVTGGSGLRVLNAIYQGNPRNQAITVTLSNATANANDYAGTTTVDAYGTLVLAAPNQIPNGAGKGNLVVNGTLKLGGWAESVNGLSGSGVVDGGAGAAVLTLGDGDANGVFSGIIQNTNGSLAVVKTGTGVQTLSGLNSFGGGTTVGQGTLVVPTLYGLSSFGSSITNHATLVIDTAGHAEIPSVIDGAGSVVLTGGGTAFVLRAQAYAGATTVSGGVLRLGRPTAPVSGMARWFDASTLNLADGAVVTNWPDLSGNNAHAINATGARLPTYAANAVNGLGAVHLYGTGVNDTGQYLLFPADTAIRSTYQIFKGSSFILTHYNSFYDFHGQSDTDPTAPLWDGTYASSNIRGGTTRVNRVAVNGTTYRMPTNEASGFNLVHVDATNTVRANGFNRDRAYHNGDQYQAETIIYDRVLTAAERLQNELYLTGKWRFGLGAAATNLLPTATVLSIAGTGAIDLGGGAQTVGALSSADASTRVMLGGGTLTVNGGLATAFAGVISDSGGSSSGVGGGLMLAGGGSLELTGANTYSGPTVVSNGQLLVQGSLGSGTVTVAAGGTLGGTGVIGGSVQIQAAGTLAPGATLGTLSISGTLTLAGATVLEADKAAGVVTHDRVAGLASVAYGGTLTVTATGQALALGDSLTLFSAASYGGWFSGLTLPAAPDDTAWDTNNLRTNGVLDLYAFTFGTQTLATAKNTAAELPTAKLLQKASSSRGTPGLASVSATSAMTGSVEIVGTNIVYTPPTNYVGADTFSCALEDGNGAITVIVDVTVTNADNVSGNILPLSLSGGNVLVRFMGISGTEYILQSATNILTPPVTWLNRVTNTAPTNGLMSYLDLTATNIYLQYYRTVVP